MWTAAVLPGLRGCAVKIRDRKENGKKRGAEKGSFLFPLEGEAELLKVLTWSANEPGGEPLCPELPRFVDYFQDGKREYLVMEYLRGVTLGAYLRGGNVCLEEDILKLSIGLCGFLEKLHRHVPPILYLDLAPDNILLTPSGGFRITDLGAAAAWHWREKTCGNNSVRNARICRSRTVSRSARAGVGYLQSGNSHPSFMLV